MTDRVMTTAAQEAIRIAEAYLPKASNRRKKALALEIVGAINLCEAELTAEITKGIDSLMDSSRS